MSTWYVTCSKSCSSLQELLVAPCNEQIYRNKNWPLNHSSHKDIMQNYCEMVHFTEKRTILEYFTLSVSVRIASIIIPIKQTYKHQFTLVLSFHAKTISKLHTFEKFTLQRQVQINPSGLSTNLHEALARDGPVITAENGQKVVL